MVDPEEARKKSLSSVYGQWRLTAIGDMNGVKIRSQWTGRSVEIFGEI